MDFRARILAAIDHLSRPESHCDAEVIAHWLRDTLNRVSAELRRMSRDKLVAYDRKAGSWRRV